MLQAEPDRVKVPLMLDDENGQISRWLRNLFGIDTWLDMTIYATNLVKCTLDKPSSDQGEGGFNFLKDYFSNCQKYLRSEIKNFQPLLVIGLGESVHRYLRGIFDGGSTFTSMKKSFPGRIEKVSIDGQEFYYSPCLHLQTFRVAEKHGNAVSNFKSGLRDFFKLEEDDNL